MRLLLLPMLFLSACAADAGLSELMDTDADPDFSPDSDADTDIDDGVDVTEDAAYLSLGGELTIVAGVPDPDLSELTLSWGTGTEVLCTAYVPLLTAAVAEAPEGEGALSWWSLTLDTTPTDCAYPIPASLSLGFAAYDASLEPAADEDGFGGMANSLYGLLVQYSDLTPVYLFGVAGTDAQFSGDAGAVVDGPVPDGQYGLTPLYQLPLPE